MKPILQDINAILRLQTIIQLFLLQIFLRQKAVLKHLSFFSLGNHDFYRKVNDKDL